MNELTIEDFNNELRKLIIKLDSSLKLAKDAKLKIARVIQDGHLRSTLTMLQSDIVLRRELEWIAKPINL